MNSYSDLMEGWTQSERKYSYCIPCLKLIRGTSLQKHNVKMHGEQVKAY